MNLQSSSSSLLPKLLQIFLRLDDGNGYQLLVQPNLTMDQLTARIRRCPLLLPPCFRLVYMGRPLTNPAATLKDLKLHQRSIIHIENISPNSPKCLKIDVCIYFQDEITVISCMTTDTVYDLKQKLKKVINILPKKQILVFRGTILSNQRTIEEYHIKANSLLCLTVEYQKKQSEFSPIPSINLQTAEFKEGINSVILKERKNSKEMFRSEVFLQRPPFEIEIREKDNFDDSLFKREFSFGGLCPQLSEIVLGKHVADLSNAKSSEFYSESEISKDHMHDLDRSLFKKVTIK